MNTGVISSRYAKALFLYVQETGNGRKVCQQALGILFDTVHLPETYEPEIEKFISLMREAGRLDHLKFSLMTFVRMYFESAHIKYVRLYVAQPDPGLEERIKDMLRSKTGNEILLETRVRPELIGGFYLKVGDYVLDASVRHQLDIIAREMTTENNRIV